MKTTQTTYQGYKQPKGPKGSLADAPMRVSGDLTTI